jgi:hypothetical protein
MPLPYVVKNPLDAFPSFARDRVTLVRAVERGESGKGVDLF